MTELAAIIGTFADLKTVKTRSVVQMVIEIPIEQGAQIIEAFGFPRPGEEVPVAVARMDPEKAKATPAPPQKPRTPFHDLPLSQQAGIRCQDERFQQYLATVHPKIWQAAKHELDSGTSDDRIATFYVQQLCCEGHSRANLDNVPKYAERWKTVNVEFERWAGLAPEER